MQLAEPPVVITRGEGVYLFDDTGKKYIDAISSWWVNLHGHAHPYIAQKVSEQLRQLEHVIFAGFTHQPAIELAERLLSILPPNQSRIFYSDNGSTAVEVAIKMSVQYWHNKGVTKRKVIAFEHSYHGDTFGAMSVSERGKFTHAFNDLLFEVIRIPFPANGCEQQTIDEMKSQINRNRASIAAFIYEPLVLGAGGMLMYDSVVLEQLMLCCADNNIISIADEVMTGFGRTGKYFATGYLKTQPDIVCLSKGITGGTMPMGVTSCTHDIYAGFLSDDRDKTFYHGHSYTANPVACAAAIASYDLLCKEECQQSIQRISAHHNMFIKNNLANKVLKNLRSTGTILAMDFQTSEPTSYFHSLRDQLYHFFLEKGIILRPLGNTIYVMPPYCISDDELQYIYEAIEGCADGLS
jgi:adenosylmethionine-8-amino-7-oxononanoate aminotransferase